MEAVYKAVMVRCCFGEVLLVRGCSSREVLPVRRGASREAV